MSVNRQQAILKLREDHAYMIELMQRIIAICTRRDSVDHCEACPSNQRRLCHDDIEQLIRSFVEVTLRHNLVESAYMAECVPAEHRAAHNRAHLEIAEHLRAVRVVFASGGNGVVAIEGIERALDSISQHLTEFDAPLEQYLLAAA